MRGFRLSPKAYLQKFRTKKRNGDDSYSQFLHKLKDVQKYHFESKQITEFQSLCDDMWLEQFRSVLPDEVGVFVDQGNVSSAKLAYLFYESNRDGNTKIDARRNFNSSGNQSFKPKNFQEPNVNLEPSKNGINAVRGNRKPEWVAQKPVASQIRCVHCEMANHKISQCLRLQPRSNNCAGVELENQRIIGDQLAIPLYVNGKLADGYRDSGLICH